MLCPNCQRVTTDPGAIFCAHCGTALGPPVTVTLPDPPSPSPPDPPPAPPSGLSESSESPVDNRLAACVGLVAAGCAVVGAFQAWLRIRIAGFLPPGSAETGWSGGDGRTIVVAGVVSAVAAGALFAGRRDLWLKVALLIAGGVTVVISMVHMVDAGSKARDIEDQFGIASGDVRAQVGFGLYLVLIGGLGLLFAGVRARPT